MASTCVQPRPPIFRQPCCRPIGRSQSRPTSSSTSNFGAFDEPRAADADQAADRPRRRPWWASASIRARQQRQPSQAAPADRRADAVGGLQCSRCMAICGALDVQGAVEPRIAPRGGRGGQQNVCKSSYLFLIFRFVYSTPTRQSGSGRTRGRSLWRTRWSPHNAPRRYGRSASRRCR